MISGYKQILLNSHYANIIIVSSQKLNKGNIGLGQVLKLQPQPFSPGENWQHVIVFETKTIVKIKICKEW